MTDSSGLERGNQEKREKEREATMNSVMMLAQGADGAACGGMCWVYLVLAFAAGVVAGFLAAGFICRARKAKPKSDKRAKAKVKQVEDPRPPLPEGSTEIYVGNLSYDLTEDELRKAFEKFGAVSHARVVTYPSNGKSKGFGFVVMPNRPEAEAAIAAMNDAELMGRKMRVNEARKSR